jgi:hypothetical protein
MSKETKTVDDRVRMGAELSRLFFRLQGLKESKKESAADFAVQIKACEKEMSRLAAMLQEQQLLFGKKETSNDD